LITLVRVQNRTPLDGSRFVAAAPTCQNAQIPAKVIPHHA
jgi:hypothetical protein